MAGGLDCPTHLTDGQINAIIEPMFYNVKGWDEDSPGNDR